eukprot:6418854-Pyramimonas_sp.AAC.1
MGGGGGGGREEVVAPSSDHHRAADRQESGTLAKWQLQRNDDDGVPKTRSPALPAPRRAAVADAVVVVGPPAMRRLRSRSRERRRALLWDMAREDARMQCRDLDIRTVVHQPLLDVSTDEWLCRLDYLRRGARR